MLKNLLEMAMGNYKIEIGKTIINHNIEKEIFVMLGENTLEKPCLALENLIISFNIFLFFFVFLP